MRFAHVEGRLADIELSLRSSEENRTRCTQELRASDEPEEDQWEDPEVMGVPRDFEFNRGAAHFEPLAPPPCLDTQPNEPQHFQMHEEGEWEREPSAEDGYPSGSGITRSEKPSANVPPLLRPPDRPWPSMTS